MADFKIKVTTEGIQKVDQLNRSIEQTQSAMDGASGSILGVDRNLLKLAGTVAIATTAYRVLSTAIKDSVSAYQTQEVAVAKLEATLKSTGNAAGFTSKELQQFASELQAITTYGDEATIAMMSVLNTFKEISGDTYKRAVRAIQDVSTVMGQDLQSSAVQIGKALNDPIGGLSALTRVGINFTDQQKNMVKQLVETNRTVEAQAVILQELESQFGGASEAIANTSMGRMQQLKNAWGDLYEVIGQATVSVASNIDTTSVYMNLIQTINEEMTKAFSEVGEASSDMSEFIIDGTKISIYAIGGLYDILETVVDIMQVAYNSAKSLFYGIQVVSGKTTLAIWEGWQSFYNSVSGLVENMVNSTRKGFETLVNTIINGVNIAIDGLNKLGANIKKISNVKFDSIKFDKIDLDRDVEKLLRERIIPAEKGLLEASDNLKKALKDYITSGGGIKFANKLVENIEETQKKIKETIDQAPPLNIKVDIDSESAKEASKKIEYELKKAMDALFQYTATDQEKITKEFADLIDQLEKVNLLDADTIEKINEKYLEKLEKLKTKDIDDQSRLYDDFKLQLANAISNAIIQAFRSGDVQGALASGLSGVGGALFQGSMNKLMIDAMGKGKMDPLMMGGIGAGLMVGGALLQSIFEEEKKEMVQQTNFLEKISGYQKDMLEETKAFRVLNRIFGTSTMGSAQPFLRSVGGGFVIDTSRTGGVQKYFEELLGGDPTKATRVRTGQETVRTTKEGFFGIGKVDRTDVIDIWREFTGAEITALEFLSQFGVDAEGRLTGEGLSALQGAFGAWESLMATLDDFALNETDVERIERRLSRINIRGAMDAIASSYGRDLERVGINIGTLTAETIGQAFNETTLAELIRNNPSLNIQDLTAMVQQLNNELVNQARLTWELSEAYMAQTSRMLRYEEELIGYEEQIQRLTIQAGQGFVSVFNQILNSITQMRNLARSTSETIGTKGISDFWDMNAKFMELIGKDDYEGASRVFSDISSLGRTLASQDQSLTDNLREYFDMADRMLGTREDVIKVDIVSGLGQIVGLNQNQLTELKLLLTNGRSLQSALDSIDGLSEDQEKALIAMVGSGDTKGLLSTEATSSSLVELANLQLNAIKEQQSQDKERLGTQSFKYMDYLGTQEKLDIARTLNKPFEQSKQLIENLQAFDIKNQDEDLSHLRSMLGWTMNTSTGAFGFNQDVFNDIKKLKEFLPEDIKVAMNTLLTDASNQATARRDLMAYAGASEINTQNEVNALLQRWADQDRLRADAQATLSAELAKPGMTANQGLMRNSQTTISDASAEMQKIEAELATAQAQLDTIRNSRIANMQANQSILDRLPQFKVGSPFIPHDMVAQIHQGEMVIDPQSSKVLREYGINLNTKDLTKAMEKNYTKMSEMTTKLSNLETMFRAVTNGGASMIVEVM